jgi:four helix bundle protein
MEKPHKKLKAWKQSMDLVIEIYRATEDFPSQEIYGLTNQIRRAAVSIPSNIAEGAARQTKKEFANYLHVAQGSLSELDTQIELARRLGYLNDGDWKVLDQQMERIDKMISGFIKRLNQKSGNNVRRASRKIKVEDSRGGGRLTPHP